MTDHNPSRPCGHIHPDTGWPDLTYCTRAKNHTGPHHSALKNATWGGEEMSYQMSVPLARRLAGGEIHNFHAGLAIPAARTIVAQAEQIERLQFAIEEWGYRKEMTQDGLLANEDMEPPA